MRPIAAFAAFLLLSCSPFSPPARAGSIRGVFLEKPANTPLAAVEVVVRRAADSTVVAHTTTREDGSFRLDSLPPDRYRLRASLLGHVPYARAVLVLSQAAPDLDLRTQSLAVAPLQVNGVTTSSERSTVVVAPDRNIYLTKDMPAATNGTATDVLRTVPELDVDINGGVSLRGSSGVTFQFNGRAAPMKGEALTAYLKQFPASRIERIEVVANPSAKFDPEGAAGIVNIVLKDNVDLGLSGNVYLTAGNRSSGPNTHVGWQKGRFTLYGGGSGWWGRNHSTSESLRHNLLAPLASWYQSRGASDSHSGYGLYDASVDFTLDKRSTFYGTLNGTASSYVSEPVMHRAVMDSALTPVQLYDRTDDYLWPGRSNAVTVGFQHVLEKGRNEWSAEFMDNESSYGSTSDGVQRTRVPEGTADQASRQVTENGYLERSLQLDDTRPLGAKGKLELGYRGAYRRNTYSSDLAYAPVTAPAITPPGGTSDYAHHELFNSAYVTASSKYGPFSVQLGARGEAAHTTFDVHTSGHRYVYDYRSLFPSANLAWDFGKGRTVRLTYSRRLERPSAGLLNPEVPSTDSLNRSVGNPSLGPKYTHSVSLAASWSGNRGMLRLAPYYRETTDNWDRVTRVDAGGVATSTWLNASSVRNAGVSVTASLRQTKRLGGTLGFSVFHEHHDATNLSSQYLQDATGWSANANLMLKTTSRLDLQGYLSYSPAQTQAQGRTSAVSFSSIGSSWKFNDRSSASLWISDPFNLYRYRLVTRDATYEQEFTSRYASRGVSLSLSWSWGKPPEQKERKQKGEQAPQEPAPSQ